MDDGQAFASERGRLEQLSSQRVRGVRQHFLRMRPGVTLLAMTSAGLVYDASFGCSDRNGFRLGVADVVPTWHAAGQRRTGLDEVPLTWMDRALSKYQRIEDPEVWIDQALELAGAAREVNGLWVGLWHPNLTQAMG